MSGYIVENAAEDPSTSINAQNYRLLAHDVRKTDEMSTILTEKFNIDVKRPTLILTECLLVYLKP